MTQLILDHFLNWTMVWACTEGPQLEVKSKQMLATSEKMLFQSENYQYMEQVASQCRGGFLSQLLQETTGRLEQRMWNYKRRLHPLLLPVLQVT